MRLLHQVKTVVKFFEQQNGKTVEGCRVLLALIDKPADLGAQAERGTQIEHECDDITHAVVASLHKTFITPLDRNDIYRLITRMDDIMDLVEAAADRFALYEIHRSTPDVGELVRTLVSSAEHVREAVSGL